MNNKEQFIYTGRYYLACVAAFVIIFTACGSHDRQRKEKLAAAIGRETCDNLSNVTVGVVGGVVNEIFSQIIDGKTSNLNTGEVRKVPDK